MLLHGSTNGPFRGVERTRGGPSTPRSPHLRPYNPHRVDGRWVSGFVPIHYPPSHDDG